MFSIALKYMFMHLDFIYSFFKDVGQVLVSNLRSVSKLTRHPVAASYIPVQFLFPNMSKIHTGLVWHYSSIHEDVGHP